MGSWDKSRPQHELYSLTTEAGLTATALCLDTWKTATRHTPLYTEIILTFSDLKSNLNLATTKKL